MAESALWLHDGELDVDTVSLVGFGAAAVEGARRWATRKWGLPEARQGGNGYRVCQGWKSGFKLFSGPINPDQQRADGEVVGEHGRIYLDGSFCRAHSPELLEFGLEWRELGFMKCTRFDSRALFGDGKGRGLIDRAEGSCDAGELAGPREYESRGPKDARTGKRSKGVTLYMGRRTSERVSRIYDDGLKCGDAPEGERIAFETEHKGESARLAYLAWLAAGERERGREVEQYVELPTCDGEDAGAADTVVECLGSLVLARLNFVRRREGDRSVKRAEVVPWWAEFVEGIRRTALVVKERVAESLERTARWMRRQVGGAVAELIVAAGGDVSMVLDLIGVETVGVRVRSRAAYELQLIRESAAASDGLYRGRWAVNFSGAGL